MFTRRKSLGDNQTILGNFVKNDILVSDIKVSSSQSTPRAKTTPSNTKKRVRPLSPKENSLQTQCKRLHIEQKMEPQSGKEQQSTTSSTIALNPELTELKRQIFAGFETLIEPLKQEIKELKEDQKVLFECDQITNSHKLERKLIKNDEKHRKLEFRISLLEDQLLEKNVIFRGLHEEEYEDKKDIKVQVVKAIANTMSGEDYESKKALAGKTSIDSVERIGKYNPLRARPVKVKFREKDDVDNLFKHRKKLPRGVYIDKEYSRTTEKERRLVRPILRAARRTEKYKGKVRMEGPHLIIDSKHYHRFNLHTLPDDLDPIEATSTSNDTIVGFFGELHPFSNFHPSTFICENMEFHSSEQFIQMKAAEYFKDEVAKERIMKADDAEDCKDIARDINSFNRSEWSKVAQELCEPGITQKFLQNQSLLATLMDTGNKTIVESSHDTIWGTGTHLGSKDALNKQKWTGTNILGKILMGIRDKQIEPFLIGDARESIAESTEDLTDMATDNDNQ